MNVTVYGVFEDVKYLCFFIVTSQISNHYILKLSHSRIMVKVMHFFKRSKNGYGYFWRYQINTISLQAQELFEPLCKVKQAEVV